MARVTNALITFEDANIMGLYPLDTAPPNTNQIVTKGDLNQWYYMDNSVEPFKSYPNNRCPRYQDVLNAALGPLPNFYLYNVTRLSIPGATGAFFTYLAPDGSTQTILQDTYGFVGQFCMQENSYQNNQYTVYSISQVGICYPDNSGTTYPRPVSPQFFNTNFLFTVNPSYEVRDVGIYNSAGGLEWGTNGVYNNDHYLDQFQYPPGTYLIRFFVYTIGGIFVEKFGFPGYPAYKLIILAS
jgi:hypothetical protein